MHININLSTPPVKPPNIWSAWNDSFSCYHCIQDLVWSGKGDTAPPERAPGPSAPIHLLVLTAPPYWLWGPWTCYTPSLHIENLCVSCSLYPHAHLTVIHPSTVVTSFWNLLRSPLRSNQDWHLTSVFSLPPVHASNMASHWIKPLVFFYLLFLLSKHKTCPITSIWCTFDG